MKTINKEIYTDELHYEEIPTITLKTETTYQNDCYTLED